MNRLTLALILCFIASTSLFQAWSNTTTVARIDAFEATQKRLHDRDCVNGLARDAFVLTYWRTHAERETAMAAAWVTSGRNGYSNASAKQRAFALAAEQKADAESTAAYARSIAASNRERAMACQSK